MHRLRSKSLFFLTLLTLIKGNAFAQQPLPIVEATAPIQISANMPAFGDVTDFQISPDNETAVYIADPNNDDVFELFSVKLDGSAPPIRLSVPNPATGGDVLEIVGFSANGDRVIYTADQTEDERDEILTAMLNGSARTSLTPNVNANNVFLSLVLTPDNSRIIYVPLGGFSNHIYSISVSGGTTVRLNDNFALNTSLTASDPNVSRDSSKVLYRINTAGGQQLHIANTNGSGTAVRLDGNGAGSDRVFDYEISNDNQRVVYHADQDVANQFELYSVAATGGPVTKLNLPLPAGAEVEDFRMNTLNSNFVYYIADQFTFEKSEVFSVPITGGAPVRLSPPVASNSRASFRSHNGNGQIISYIFNDRSSSPFTLTFRGVQQANNQDVLISKRVTGLDFFIVIESSSGEYITFLARELSNREIISLKLGPNATNERVLISEENSNSLGNYPRVISNDERLVAYTADDNIDSSLQNLFATSLIHGHPVRINPNLASGSEIMQIATSDNGAYVAYRADQNTVGEFNLYVSEITINEPIDDELCVPIRAQSGNIAMICL